MYLILTTYLNFILICDIPVMSRRRITVKYNYRNTWRATREAKAHQMLAALVALACVEPGLHVHKSSTILSLFRTFFIPFFLMLLLPIVGSLSVRI